MELLKTTKNVRVPPGTLPEIPCKYTFAGDFQFKE